MYGITPAFSRPTAGFPADYHQYQQNTLYPDIYIANPHELNQGKQENSQQKKRRIIHLTCVLNYISAMVITDTTF